LDTHIYIYKSRQLLDMQKHLLSSTDPSSLLVCCEASMCVNLSTTHFVDCGRCVAAAQWGPSATGPECSNFDPSTTWVWTARLPICWFTLEEKTVVFVAFTFCPHFAYSSLVALMWAKSNSWVRKHGWASSQLQ